jgi:hypothetical protein
MYCWGILSFAFSQPAAGGERPSELARYDALIKPAHRQHWAFQPVRRPVVPAPKDASWTCNPVDAFVRAKLEAQGWQPPPSVEPRTWLRRIHLDVIGLPPTPEEQAAFLKNPSPETRERVIRDLLARPSYGERWGRHWLDLVRFAETNGYERDATKPHAWRYRDYVIRAFNSDKPYDRFILEQLAGDELDDASAETLIATGFLRLGPWDDEPADFQEDRYDQLDDMVSTTALVFQGLTLGCARCHNHKFEPLTQLDYYRLVAVFNPLRRPQDGRTELDLPAGSPMQIETAKRLAIALSLGGLGSVPVMAPHSLRPGTLAVAVLLMSGLRLPNADLPRGYFLQEPSPRPPPTHLLLRGKASRPGVQVEPGVPAVLVALQPAFTSVGARTSLRRRTLASWIASPANPLTARVLVNRVWHHHFGEGLVRTTSDFGVMGQPPTHPELLDWLADRFVRDGWSIKKLHQLILTSNTYAMSKKWRPKHAAKDPENRLLWRFPYKRLEVEVIRDSMLTASGQFNSSMYGPSMYPQIPKEALDGHSDRDKIWQPSNERASSRRTVYAFIKRSMIVPLLEALDLCDTTRSSAQRLVTTVAPQALSLYNGDFVTRQAGHLARRLLREAGDDPNRQIERAYELALCRPPSAVELLSLSQFLAQESGKLIEEASTMNKPMTAFRARHHALQQVCRVIFNLNEFVYAD